MSHKLIILNGSPAAGKSTVARKLHTDLPMSLLADLDAWRQLISGWKDFRKESLAQTYLFTLGAVDSYLAAKNSVIIDKSILSDNTIIDKLIEIGNKHNAEVYEFILNADKDIIITRASERGFQENGLLTPQRVIELWDTTQNLVQQRPNSIVIDTGIINSNEVYEKIKSIVFKK